MTRFDEIFLSKRVQIKSSPVNLKLTTFPTGLLEVNTIILSNDATKSAVLIDPGGNAGVIYNFLKKKELKLECILHTHAHFDHIAGTTALLTDYPEFSKELKIYLHPEDLYLWDHLDIQGKQFNLTFPKQTVKVTDWLEDARRLEFPGIALDVIHTPGHSPGSCTFYIEMDNGILISGDVIFQGGIGRTDLWRGSYDVLMNSIMKKILVFPEKTRIIAGHGPDTTIGDEKALNPYLID